MQPGVVINPKGESQPAIGGMPAARWIRTHRQELLNLALTELTHPAASTGEPAHHDADLHWIIGYNIDLFARALEQPSLPVTEDEAAELAASAARRAADGQPVENLMRAYQIGFHTLWRAVLDRAGDGDTSDLLRLTAQMHTHLLEVTTLVLRGFRHETARLSIGERDPRYAVFAALLAGDAPPAAASRAGITLADHYLVCRLHLGIPHESHGADRPLIARHRRANTVQRLLQEHADGHILAVIGGDTGTVLIPVPGTAAQDTARIREALHRLPSALDVNLHVGTAIAAIGEVPDAAAESADVAEIAVATGRPPGVYALPDVLTEYQLTRPGPGHRLLLRQLAPLDEHPEWEETLRTFLRSRCDRRRTAESLHLHPNTVDYRLARVAQACGLDASDPVQRAVAHAALCVRDLATYRTRRAQQT